jgi:hypothetical protein
VGGRPPYARSTPTTKEIEMKKLLTTATIVFATAVALGSAGSLWLAGAETALAPEPAQLIAALTGSNGNGAAAWYVNSDVRTDVVKWPGSYVYNTTLVAGQPCSTVDLAAWMTTSRVIVATGNYRKCA